MDLTDSEYSEAGESGWTMYLDHSPASKDHFDGSDRARDEEEEEDSSMVSDASSGPRYLYCGDDEEFFDKNNYHYSLPLAKTSKMNKKKIKEKHGGVYQQHSCLEDTASSKNLSLSRNEASMQHLDFTQGFSATKFKGKSTMRKHFGFLQPSHGKPASEEQGGGTGNQRRKRG